MDIIPLSELKFIHSRNNISERGGNKISNLKKIFSYKAISPKENFTDRISLNINKTNSLGNKRVIPSNIKETITPFNKHHSFNFRYQNQKIPIKFSLYTLLAMKKNDIYDIIENFNQLENNKVNKTNNINILKNKEFIKTQAEIGKKNRNILESKKKSMIYLSYINNDYNESEKIRFYSMMKKLSMLKYILEMEPNKKNKIIKNFLLKEGILDKKYLNEECFKNLIKFIKRNSIINPALNFKDNLINILNNKLNYSLENILNNHNDATYKNIQRMKTMKNIMNLKKTIYRNKNIQFQTLDNFKINRFDLDLKNNLNRQTYLWKKEEKLKVHDIKKEPEKIMDFLGVKLNEEKNDIVNKNIYYKLKKNLDDNLNVGFSSDSDIFKKKHLMTEFACFIKAKDNFGLKLIKTKYNL